MRIPNSADAIKGCFVPGYLLKKGDYVRWLDDTYVFLSHDEKGVYLADKKTTKAQLKYNETDHVVYGPLKHMYLKYSK